MRLSFFATWMEHLYSTVLRFFPLLVLRIDLINRCNLRCRMCHYGDTMHNIPLKIFSFEEVQGLLNSSGRHIRRVMLSCGYEPLLSRDFKTVVEYIHLNHPKIKISFCSNGLLLRQDMTIFLIENRVASAEFSVDGVTKSTYEKIRINSNFDTVVNNLKFLKEEKERRKSSLPKIQINYVIQRDNLHEAEQMVRFAGELGADSILFRKVFQKNDNFNTVSLNNAEEFNSVRKSILRQAKKYNLQIMIPAEIQ